MRENHENTKYYKMLEDVPEWAKQIIEGGTLRGLTSINPMWRIEALTTLFGPCGTGWRVEVKDYRIDNYSSGAMVTVYVQLYYKEGEEWSEPIPGFGTATMTKVSGEVFKQAYTDALGQCTKQLGLGANIYKEGKRPGGDWKKADE